MKNMETQGENMKNLTKIAKEKIEETKGFIVNNNYKIIKVEENYCELEGIITETSLNPFKIVHGGYIVGLADTAAGIAAMTDERAAVTLDSNINYLKKATGNKLLAKATTLKKGKTIAVFEVTVYDEDNEIIAKVPFKRGLFCWK